MADVDDYLIAGRERPDWLVYPDGLVELIRAGRISIPPWHIVRADLALVAHARLRSTLGRDLVPFALRQDCDDRACFERGKGEMVMLIHDYTSPGWEACGSLPSFAAWLELAETEAGS